MWLVRMKKFSPLVDGRGFSHKVENTYDASQSYGLSGP